MIMSYGNIIVTVKCKIQLVEIIRAAVVETTEAAASVASTVCYGPTMDLCSAFL